MRLKILGIFLMIGLAAPAVAQVSIGFGVPGLSIGVNLGGYPDLERVPGYPVYYAPRADSNVFFYDGAYWAYARDDWYVSSWYDGPWDRVAPYDVPDYVLRVPVRYYRRPPAYFRGWQPEAPPRWGQHWGADWEQRRSGWDRRDRRSAPPPAPRPDYQRSYSGNRYPRPEEQSGLRQQNYRYQPREDVVRERYQQAPRQDQRRQQMTPRPAPQYQDRSARPERADANRREPRDQGKQHQSAPVEQSRDNRDSRGEHGDRQEDRDR